MDILQQYREDDFVEYFLFPDIKSTDVELENYEGILENLLEKVNHAANEYCAGYLWHKDAFRVTPRYKNSNLLIESDQVEELPPYLHGITHYGDNIQDEWFIVSLILHLTRKFPGLVCRIIDSDGEFLMIEAADHLPKWANPETCDKKVFIVNGSVHLIQESPSILQSIVKIRATPAKYKVPSSIGKCIEERIKDYPSKISENLHRTILYVPVGVAAVLKENPALISAAVLAFCNRDPIDIKVCKAMRYFAPENCVYVSAVFTKCLYAMLVHSKYLPDRRTGWYLPQIDDSRYKSHLLGVKLACGFEILASQAKASQSLDTDKGWKSYFDSLSKKGYFKANIEGSQEYTKLLGIAKDYYIENRDSMRFAPKIGHEIVSILKKNDFDSEEFRKEEPDLPKSDDDGWLNISPDELDDMLNKKYGIKKMFTENGNDAGQLTGMISDFLEQKSEFDGVDLGKFQPIKPPRKKNISQPPQDGPIDFDADAFGSHVKHLLDLVIPEDKWDSNSDMSDYEDDDYDRNIEDMTANKTKTKNNLDKYMEQMDQELANTTIGKSFEQKEAPSQRDLDDFDDIESFKPVNIDVNTLKNMMESYQSQVGGHGPVSSLLGSMGVQMQLNGDEAGSSSKKETDV